MFLRVLDSRSNFYKVVVGTWLLVWLYAFLHDLYLIRIHPPHFTEWHYHIPFTQNYNILALIYSLGASVSPGLIFGLSLYICGRLFNAPKLSVSFLLKGTAFIFIAVEICAGLAGLYSWKTKNCLFPEELYPELSHGLIITQSIQLTAYLSGALFSLLWLMIIIRIRRRLK